MDMIRTLTAVSVCLIAHSFAAQAQDAEAGAKVFRKCAACHKVGDGAKNGVGPVLTNVVGRSAGSYEGYRYSETLQAAGDAGLVWDAEKINAYIADPKEFMKEFLNDPKARPKMTFKLKDEQDRLDVIAYLQQFSEAVDDEAAMDAAPANDPGPGAFVAAEDKVCVRNAAAHSYFFAAEGKGVERLTANLAPGEVLCATTRGAGQQGVVSVFESETGFEGCSRLVQGGTLEEMRIYADFDRCAWSSNTSG
jgi:cytochrome c2